MEDSGKHILPCEMLLKIDQKMRKSFPKKRNKVGEMKTHREVCNFPPCFETSSLFILPIPHCKEILSLDSIWWRPNTIVCEKTKSSRGPTDLRLSISSDFIGYAEQRGKRTILSTAKTPISFDPGHPRENFEKLVTKSARDLVEFSNPPSSDAVKAQSQAPSV